MIDIKALTFKECIYSDQQGRVKILRARLKIHKDGQALSKDVVVKAKTYVGLEESAQVIEELTVSNSRHRHICEVYGYTLHTFPAEQHSKMLIVMEELKCDLDKDAQRRFAEGRFYTEKELLEMLWQFVDALRFMQRKGLCHRDLKPHNLFIAMDGTYKISDFGSCIVETFASARTLVGSPLYLSPILKEAYKDRLLGGPGEVRDNIYKSDVFSLGVTFIFLCLLSAPTTLMNIPEMNREIMKIVHEVGARYTWNLMKYLVKMMNIEEKNRPDFEELMHEMENDHDAFPSHAQVPLIPPMLQAQLQQFSEWEESTAAQLLWSAFSLPVLLTAHVRTCCSVCGEGGTGSTLYCQQHWACAAHESTLCPSCHACPNCYTLLQCYESQWYCAQCQIYPYSG